MAARSNRFHTCVTIYNGDRWKVPGAKDIYIAYCRTINGVGFWELYHAPTPKLNPVYVFGGLESYFGAKMKNFYNENGLKKIRTPLRDRVGPSLSLWGLTH